MHDRHHRVIQALLLLHILAFALLCVFGVVRLFMAYLGNAVEFGALLIFLFGAAAGLSSWGYYTLSQRNPYRNRRAMVLLAMIAWIDALILGFAVPYLFYRLQEVPWTSWGVILPTALFAALATRASIRHGITPSGSAGDTA